MLLFRADGFAIKKELFLRDLESAYDRAEAAIGAPCNSENVQQFQDALKDIHLELDAKYPKSIEISYPTTKKAFKRLHAEFGCIGFAVEEGKIVGYVL